MFAKKQKQRVEGKYSSKKIFGTEQHLKILCCNMHANLASSTQHHNGKAVFSYLTRINATSYVSAMSFTHRCVC